MTKLLSLLLCVVFSVACSTSGSKSKRNAPGEFRGKPVVLWVDQHLLENITARLAVESFCAAAHDAGVTHLALELKDATGSEISTAASLALREQATRAGLRIAQVLPCFVAPPDASETELSQTAIWNGTAFEMVTSKPPLPRRFSPAIAVNRERELQSIRRAATDDKSEFLVLSGCGFEDTLADFSAPARASYEAWSGVTTRRWPQDVTGDLPSSAPLGPAGRGPLWQSWMMWRGSLMRDFLINARAAVNQPDSVHRPALVVLVDGPYAAHQREGLNWAGPRTSAMTDYPWLGANYSDTACGHLIDIVALGFWNPDLLAAEDAKREGYAWWASIEGGSAAARRYLPPETKRWGCIALEKDKAWRAAITRAYLVNDGVLLADVRILLDDPQGWNLLREALTLPR